MPPSPGVGPDEPVVLVESVKGGLRLAALDRNALALGLKPGLTLADARARIPTLAALPSAPEADAALLAGAASACERFTPLVALDGRDGLLLDVTGCSHLFGGERDLVRQALARLTRAGLETRGALAGTPEAARALARYAQGGPILVAPGEEARAVRPLPVAALGIASETRAALSLAGLKRIADLADRPSAPLVARFGEDLAVQLRRVLGREDRRITPLRPEPAFSVEQAFAEPIAHMDAIEACLRDLAGRIADRLDTNGKGGRLFEVSFFRTDDTVRRVRVETGRPCRDPDTVLRLLRERLDAIPDPLDPGFGFDLIRLAAPVAEPLTPAQRSLDGGVVQDDGLGDLVDRLVARFGARRVLRFSGRDTHDPARAVRFVAATQGASLSCPEPQPGEPPLRPLHLLDPPQAVEALAEVPDGPPIRFRWRRVLHTVARAEGPERIAPEWWRADRTGATRDYFRVEDVEGCRFWLFREGLYGSETDRPRWFIHGLFA